jgi:hypothetical protein
MGNIQKRQKFELSAEARVAVKQSEAGNSTFTNVPGASCTATLDNREQHSVVE